MENSWPCALGAPPAEPPRLPRCLGGWGQEVSGRVKKPLPEGGQGQWAPGEKQESDLGVLVTVLGISWKPPSGSHMPLRNPSPAPGRLVRRKARRLWTWLPRRAWAHCTVRPGSLSRGSHDGVCEAGWHLPVRLRLHCYPGSVAAAAGVGGAGGGDYVCAWRAGAGGRGGEARGGPGPCPHLASGASLPCPASSLYPTCPCGCPPSPPLPSHPSAPVALPSPPLAPPEERCGAARTSRPALRPSLGLWHCLPLCSCIHSKHPLACPSHWTPSLIRRLPPPTLLFHLSSPQPHPLHPRPQPTLPSPPSPSLSLPLPLPLSASLFHPSPLYPASEANWKRSSPRACRGPGGASTWGAPPVHRGRAGGGGWKQPCLATVRRPRHRLATPSASSRAREGAGGPPAPAPVHPRWGEGHPTPPPDPDPAPAPAPRPLSRWGAGSWWEEEEEAGPRGGGPVRVSLAVLGLVASLAAPGAPVPSQELREHSIRVPCPAKTEPVPPHKALSAAPMGQGQAGA